MNEQDKVQSAEQATQTEQEQVQLSDEQQIIAKLEAELEKAKTTAAEQTDLALRVRAEAENMKRRAAQDVEKAHKFALEKFAGDLLPALDNLERSLGFIDPANEAVKALAEGVDDAEDLAALWALGFRPFYLLAIGSLCSIGAVGAIGSPDTVRAKSGRSLSALRLNPGRTRLS